MQQIERITSFSVDHDRLTPGIYISRVDGDITTYDLRTRKPNAGSFMDTCTAHSVEHMFATYIRNSAMAEHVIYFGPMGCRTGFYLLVRSASNQEVLDAVLDSLRHIIAHDGEMFGQSEIECGNFRELSLESAKAEASRYLAVLEGKSHSFSYPA